MMWRRIGFAGLYLLLFAVDGRAQTIRGIVVFPDSTTRAPGMVVVVTDERGAVVWRTLTADRGDFSAIVPHRGTYAVRVLRIGYRPTLAPGVAATQNGTTSVTVVLTSRAIDLAAVTVRGEDVCRVRSDSGAMVAKLWGEAQTALSATQIASGGPSLRSTWLRYTRTMDSAARVVREQTVTFVTGETAKPFRSSPPDSLARFGYITQDDDGYLYRAPDADALLSEQFAATHCFHVEPPRAAHPDWVGVAFRPARDRADVSDIAGIFWLDRTSAELRLLEYDYTNVPPSVEGMGGGGRVEFLRLATGNWLVSKWFIRTPVTGARSGSSVGGLGGRSAFSRPKVVMQGVRFSGGEVARVVRDGATLFSGGGAAFEAQVTSTEPELSAVGAIVELSGTPYSARTDASGIARIPNVIAGTYVANVSAPEAFAAQLPPLRRTITLADGAGRRDTVAMPRISELVATVCKAPVNDQPESLLHGTVFDASGTPVSKSRMTVTWRPVAKVTTATATVYDPISHELVTDDKGRWRLCGVPRDLPVSLRAAGNHQTSEPNEMRIPSDKALIARDIRLTAK